ncbi:host-nuclease inhibitor Gam family protein (plasmid) [Acidovorax sp. DW039]|uniref:host-nuclease inhibitor Gam family protein n=1 Tax=Acidovorax sp. DW039 TaxID=3095606 RepID=UPI0030904901|nr:host-nuclease inhibitor Gam family protein [Acidovorax sp. DW039]BEU98634.1 host-nuclease inhibitor Gam family protein [Acidovorax sp. DW039]
MSTALDTITKAAEVHSQARSLLSERVTALRDAQAALNREHLPSIKRALAKAAESEAKLRALVEEHPECFVKPKTQVLAGIKVGYAKAKGSLSFDDADAVVARIKKHFPDQVDVLIRTKEEPVKDALSNLCANDLKKIGVKVTDSGDKCVVKPVDSEVDKMVDALLKAAAREVEEA